MNAVQEYVYDNLHTRNIILKARQLGMSTFAILLMVDQRCADGERDNYWQRNYRLPDAAY